MSRYPLVDLLEATRLNVKLMAELLGTRHTANLYRLKRDGLSFDQAEKYAVKLGTLPELIWPAWREESAARAAALEEQDRRQADVTQARQRATWARRKRRQYRKNPQRDRDRAKRYYAECRPAVLAQKRRRYAATAEDQREKARLYYQANKERVKARMRQHRHAMSGRGKKGDTTSASSARTTSASGSGITGSRTKVDYKDAQKSGSAPIELLHPAETLGNDLRPDTESAAYDVQGDRDAVPSRGEGGGNVRPTRDQVAL